MSVFVVKAPFLSLKPQVYGDDHRLFCESSLCAQMVSLFAHYRLVVVDGMKRKVCIEERTWWRRQPAMEIPFECVDHIEYGFDSLPVRVLEVVEVAVSLERFRVSLALRTAGDQVHLATFHGGETSFGVGTRTGDSVPVLDACGDQADAARTFVAALKLMLDVPIGPPFPQLADAHGVRNSCEVCKRPSPRRREKCQYCGGTVTEEPAVAKEEGSR